MIINMNVMVILLLLSVLIFILSVKILNGNVDLYFIITIITIINFLFLAFVVSQIKVKKEENISKKIIVKEIKKECNIKKLSSKEFKEKREEAKKTLFIIELLIGVFIVGLFSIIGKGSWSAFNAGLWIFVLILFFFTLYNKELVDYYLCKKI